MAYLMTNFNFLETFDVIKMRQVKNKNGDTLPIAHCAYMPLMLHEVEHVAYVA